MRKEKNTAVILKLQSLPKSSGPAIVPITGCFLMFFSASLGFLLSLLLVFPYPLTGKELFLFSAAFSFTFTLIFALRFLSENKKRWIWSAAFTIGITVLVIFRFREKFFTLNDSKTSNILFLLIFALGIYLFLFLISVLTKKKNIFLFLLLVPAIFCFVMEKTPSCLSLGCTLAAFLCWDFVFYQKCSVYRQLFTSSALLALYTICVFVLTPAFSPTVFKSHPTVYKTINQLEDQLIKTFSGKDSPIKSGWNAPVFDTPAFKNNFSYEPKTGKQKLSNEAPAYTNQTMFRFHCDSPLDDTVYLRGFIGKTYTEAVWEAPEKRHWQNFLKQNDLTEHSVNELFSIPYTAGHNSNERAVKEMSLTPEFSPKFTYLPYGAQIPEGFSVRDNNELNASFSHTLDFSCFPLNLDCAPILLYPELSDSADLMQTAYHTYVQQEYTDCPAESSALLEKELSQLPAYSSMPEDPTFSDIRNAAEEIQNFLWTHASYSLSLSPVPSDSTFLREFLYNQHQGFCVHFATAGTLLFRMYGIPARYVSGYVIFPKDLASDKGSGYTCPVPDARAHAWTEIYIGEGGWVPVEMTPGSYLEQLTSPGETASADTTDKPLQDSNAEGPPQNTLTETTPKQDTKSSGKTSTDGKLPAEDLNTDKSPKTAFLSFLKQFFFVLTVCLGCLFAAFLLLNLRRTVLFKKRMGYFSRSRADCCLVIFNSILELWKIQFHIPQNIFTDAKTDDNFKEQFAPSLPEEEQTLFLNLYSESQKLCFGAEKPEKNRVRTFRRIYMRTRKKLLSTCSNSRKIYYIFILGL